MSTKIRNERSAYIGVILTAPVSIRRFTSLLLFLLLFSFYFVLFSLTFPRFGSFRFIVIFFYFTLWMGLLIQLEEGNRKNLIWCYANSYIHICSLVLTSGFSLCHIYFLRELRINNFQQENLPLILDSNSWEIFIQPNLLLFIIIRQ